MTQQAEDVGGIIRSIFWRKVTPGDFFNIERTRNAGPTGGGGQLYIDIPLGGSVSLEEFGNFVSGHPLDTDDAKWGSFEFLAYSVSAPMVAAPLTLTPRRGKNRRYRIANQNRQAAGASRHPAWSADRGFPRAPDDITSSTDPRMPDLSLLKVLLARTDSGDFLVGYTNSQTMPASWPRDIGLEVLFKPNSRVRADGVIPISADLGFNVAALGGLVPPTSGKGATPLQESPAEYGEPHRPARVVRRSGVSRRVIHEDTEKVGESGARRTDLQEAISIRAPRASEAEDWVEARLREIYTGSCVRRIGHTNLELVPLEDGFLPGADLLVLESTDQRPERFIEVKSAGGSFPSSIRLTAAELQRAKLCATNKLPYEIWVVVFGESSSIAKFIIPHFEQDAGMLTIDDLVSLDIQIDVP